MTRRMLVVAATAALAACTDGLRPPGEVLGTWGGNDAGLIVNDSGAHVHIGCTLGDVIGPIHVEPDGRFEATGLYNVNAYPISLGIIHPARFSGQIFGNSMILTVSLTDTTRQLGPVVLNYGVQPQMGPCPICHGPAEMQAAQRDAAWRDSFPLERSDLASTGRNPYFILEPGYRLVLEDRTTRLVITVLPDTRTVDGALTRVVEERETERGALVEVSRNYFAIHRTTNDVYYFGEDVDMYRHGRITSHEGSWLAGVGGARFGLMMPGQPRVGARYYQEVAPRLAMDRARIITFGASLRTPAGNYRNLLRVEETTPLEPGHTEYKLYASGIGLVQDGSLKLVRLERGR